MLNLQTAQVRQHLYMEGKYKALHMARPLDEENPDYENFFALAMKTDPPNPDEEENPDEDE